MAQTLGATPAPAGAVPGTTQTVILGGGFGGLAAANALRRALPGAHAVTVIDPTRRFLVGAGKTWVMLGERKFEEVSADRARLGFPMAPREWANDVLAKLEEQNAKKAA